MENMLWAVIVLLFVMVLLLLRLCGLMFTLIGSVNSSSNQIETQLKSIEDELPRKTQAQHEIEANQWYEEEQEAKRQVAEREKHKVSN